MAVVDLVVDEPGCAGLECDAPGLVDQARFLLDRLGLHPECELVISLVGEPEMAELHERWLGEPGPTDVLSFPMDELTIPSAGQAGEPGVMGDVVLCPAVAARQAAAAGHSLDAELALLLTHGILHLLGHDHEHPEEHRVMFQLQASLLQAWQAQGGPTVRLPSTGVPAPGPDPAA